MSNRDIDYELEADEPLDNSETSESNKYGHV